ncbi:MAG: hypothetical protein KJZ57_07985 [Anaerolineales bacterium]|nr:hypothetical protein [Anaerolineales bacterium]
MRPRIHKKQERGQAIVLIAFAFIGLIAMIGLMVDGGMLLIEYGRLKRAIDAASLSAALQYREGYTTAQLTDAATEFLQLNQSDVFDIQVDTDTTEPPPQTRAGDRLPSRALRLPVRHRDPPGRHHRHLGWRGRLGGPGAGPGRVGLHGL